jgi:tRNA (adenine22-N1)-methyltransferase
MKRINAIIKHIKPNSIVLDIGSDHALLSTSLNKHMHIKHIYNVEKNVGPLQKTINNTSALHNVTNILANGLNFNINDKNIDYCVIAGMGGINIINIMNNANANKCQTFILQPSNNASDLRRFLANRGYFIVYEEIIEERGIYYDLMVVSKHEGMSITTPQDIYFGPYNLKHPSDNFYKMFNQQKQHIIKNKLDIVNHAYHMRLCMINNL